MSIPEGALWQRRCQVVTGKNGTGLSVEDPLKITFEVTKTLLRTPNTALVKLYNLSPETEGLVRSEFDEVLINAGYGTDLLQVFRGNVKYITGYRQGNDRILEIQAADGDKDFREAMVFLTISAGAKQSELIDKIVGTFSSVILGHVGIPERTYIRGRAFVGNVRDLLDDIAGFWDAHWSIQDEVLHIVPAQSTFPTEAIIVTADTGMLSSPEIDDKGIKVRTLFEPRHLPNGKVWLDNNDIQLHVRQQRASALGAAHPSAKKQQKEIARLDPDGIYKLYTVHHEFDSRGPAHTEVRCVGLDKPIPSGKVAA